MVLPPYPGNMKAQHARHMVTPPYLDNRKARHTQDTYERGIGCARYALKLQQMVSNTNCKAIRPTNFPHKLAAESKPHVHQTNTQRLAPGA